MVYDIDSREKQNHNRGDCGNGDGDESSRIVSNDYSRIEKKIIANLKYCYDTKYLWTGSSAWKPIDNSTMSTLPAMAVLVLQVVQMALFQWFKWT